MSKTCSTAAALLVLGLTACDREDAFAERLTRIETRISELEARVAEMERVPEPHTLTRPRAMHGEEVGSALLIVVEENRAVVEGVPLTDEQFVKRLTDAVQADRMLQVVLEADP